MQSPESRDTAPPSATKSGVKRKRLVLSCFECKRRKLKCDRQLPICSRCSEVGHPERCKYDDRLLANEDEQELESPDRQNTFGQSSPFVQLPEVSHSHESQRLALLEKHVANLEARLAQATSARDGLPPTPASSSIPTPFTHAAAIESSADQAGFVLMRGKGFKSCYHGPSNPSSILSYFPRVYHFLKKLSHEHPVLSIHRQSIRLLRDARPSYPPPPAAEILSAITRHLPSEHRCRHLMRLYFKHFEGVYRILHASSFWRQFDKLWSGELTHPQDFTAVLLAAMSCARCLYPDEPLSFDGDRSSAAIEAELWIQAAEVFHSTQSQKHTTITSFQLPALLILSKRTNAIKIKRHFVLSQTFVATAVSAGLHRSPSNLKPRITLYEQEMRRRLWATITELELSCSIDSGLPSFSGALFADCEPPTNLRDDDFDEDTTDYPPVRADDTFTDCSFQRYTHHLKPLRDAISNLANKPDKHRALAYADLLSYHQLIVGKFASIPSWTSVNSSQDEVSKVFWIQNCLELQLHQLLIILHLPLATSQDTNPNNNHSRFACVDSASRTIGIYERVSGYGFSQMAIFKPDLMRATLCICLLQAQSPYNDSLISSNGEHAQIQLVEKAFDLVEERILNIGTGFQGVWLLFAASCFIESNQGSLVLPSWQKKVTDRIAALFGRIYMCQKNKGMESLNEASLAPIKPLHSPTGDTQLGSTPRRTMEHIPSMPIDGLTIPNVDSIMPGGLSTGDWVDWMQDDFNFYSFTGA